MTTRVIVEFGEDGKVRVIRDVHTAPAPKREAKKRHRLNQLEVARLYELFEAGVQSKKLAEMFHITEPAVSWRRKLWQHGHRPPITRDLEMENE